MFETLKKTILIGLVSAFAAGTSSAADTDVFNGLQGRLTVAGGTAHIPVVKDVAMRVAKTHPNIHIIVTGGGSGVGIQKVGEGLVDIGSTGRHPSSEEIKHYNLVPYQFALDGVVVAVNPHNTIKNLSTEQLRDIFTGKITNWKEVGGANLPIHLYNRDEASATREVFVKKGLGKGTILSNHATIVPSNGAAKTAVMRDAGGIVYLGMGYVDHNVKALDINGVEPSLTNAKSGKYPIVRGLYFNTRGTPKAIPEAFYHYLKTAEGQAIIRHNGYIPHFN